MPFRFRIAIPILAVAAPVLAQQTIDGCQVFPLSNVWNTPVTSLPVAANSATLISKMGPTSGLHPDFGSALWEGGRIGIPLDSVPNGQATVAINYSILGWADESDDGPFPILPDPQIEGEPGAADGDRHILTLRQGACELYELYYAYPNGANAQAQNDDWPDFVDCTVGAGGWCAASGAKYSLSSNALRPNTYTSADAAGLPILPGLARFGELATGEIRHALRFTVDNTHNSYVWPARHQAGSGTCTGCPGMGVRVRLKASVNISTFSPQAKRLLTAMKRYGMILADNGSNWYVSGIPDDGWDEEAIHEIGAIHGSDFEVVDESSLIIDPDSGETPHVFSDGFENEVTLFANWTTHVN